MSDTLCGMDYEEADDYATLWSEKRVKVRKVHPCCECGIEIQKGEEAGKADSLYDGSWDTRYRCAACLILAELAGTLLGVCAQWERLAEFINENGLDLPSPREHREKWEAA